MAPKADKTLSDLARALLVAERSASEPVALKERAVARAFRTLEEGRRPARRGGSVIERSLGSRARGPGLLAAAAFALAGLAAAGSGVFKAPDSAPPVVPVAKPIAAPRPRASVAPVVPTAEPRAEAPLDAFPSAVAPQPRPRVVAPPPSASADAGVPSRARQYAIELALLEPARSGVARGDFAGALAAVQRHRLEFPGGQLAEERSALQVRALYGLGKLAEAEAAAAAFRQRYPRSALLSWMPPRRAPSR